MSKNMADRQPIRRFPSRTSCYTSYRPPFLLLLMLVLLSSCASSIKDMVQTIENFGDVLEDKQIEREVKREQKKRAYKKERTPQIIVPPPPPPKTYQCCKTVVKGIIWTSIIEKCRPMLLEVCEEGERKTEIEK